MVPVPFCYMFILIHIFVNWFT